MITRRASRPAEDSLIRRRLEARSPCPRCRSLLLTCPARCSHARAIRRRLPIGLPRCASRYLRVVNAELQRRRWYRRWRRLIAVFPDFARFIAMPRRPMGPMTISAGRIQDKLGEAPRVLPPRRLRCRKLALLSATADGPRIIDAPPLYFLRGVLEASLSPLRRGGRDDRR